jgi:DNA polymerase III epsilon subunit-like protein
MRVLVFDTETTGLPSTRIINPDTLDLWPHIVQFSYLIYDTDLNDIIETHDSIIKVGEHIIIPEDSIQFHGITNEISNLKGVAIENILNKFFKHLQTVDQLVGHNVSFDINMVKVELLRIIYFKDGFKDGFKPLLISNAPEVGINEIKNNVTMRVTNAQKCKEYKYNLHLLTNYKNVSCTLQDSIELCNIKALTKFGKEYLKYPKLVELHQKLFDTVPNHLHNSFNDILVTLRCFMKIKHNIDLNKECEKFKIIIEQLHLL